MVFTGVWETASVLRSRVLLLLIIINIIIISLFWEFFTPALADTFSLKFEWLQIPHVSRSLLDILADFDKAVL